MTLAETASIFCQTLIKEAALRQATPDAALEIVEGALQHACQSVVDMLCRFQFEQQLFTHHQVRKASVEELCAWMLEAQQATYGEGLGVEALHPYMWAAKLHYYWDTISCYNFPYISGLLFGLGLYAHYRANPEAFKPRYDNLLASTGWRMPLPWPSGLASICVAQCFGREVWTWCARIWIALRPSCRSI